ncbi:PREDICTED: uncharacterized protein LOC108360888 [Rhagoletis zephyria]|uniref:uncharacterized protein LOC108360888 n=1 Tax=Rhagoletis zephyria TaxID=28612 RepID=UPI000811879C|nr:PREDICTED: uncharacterized protein LOC108360888 [Rhagoletis zephyria]
MSARNYYEILKTPPTASFEELRRNYKQLVLQCHPDKLQHYNTNSISTTTATSHFDNTISGTNDAASTSAATVDPIVENPTAMYSDQHSREFVAINEAWNTLKDPTKRRLYDAELMLTKLQAHSNIFARLTLADMKRCAATTTNDDSGSDNGECNGDSESIGAKGGTYWYYTYDCRCGGQYIVDESVDSEILNSNRNHNGANNDQMQTQTGEEQQIQQKPKRYDNGIDKPSSQADADSGAVSGSTAICSSNNNKGSETTGYDEDILNAGAADGEDGEVLVECSECSLVIVLV